MPRRPDPAAGEQDVRTHHERARLLCRGEVAAGELCALPHADHPVPGAGRGRRAGDDGVSHGEVDTLRAPRQAHIDRAARLPVAERVRERLLQDAVDGDLDGCRRLAQRGRVDVDAQIDARGAHLRPQLVEVGEARLRPVALAVAQLREEQPHVGERGAGRRGDRLQSSRRRLRIVTRSSAASRWTSSACRQRPRKSKRS